MTVGSLRIRLLLRESRSLAPASLNRSEAASTLLMLDDDLDYLALLERELGREDYRLLVASDAAVAFEMLAYHEVGVVLCDQRMPGMSGIEFLTKVRSMYPRAVRLMCSGHTDFLVAQTAINVGAVHKFIVKSENISELRAILKEAFQVYRKSAVAR